MVQAHPRSIDFLCGGWTVVRHQGKIGGEADGIQGIPEGHGLVIRPVGSVGERHGGLAAHDANDVAPGRFVVRWGAVQFGADGKTVRFATEAGERGDPSLVRREKTRPLFFLRKGDVAAPTPARASTGEVRDDGDF